MKFARLRVLSLLMAIISVFSLFACASQNPTNVETLPAVNMDTIEETSTAPESNPEPTVPTLPENMNPLTGLECDAELVGKRPVAVMFNNLKASLPQIGLSQFDIIHEVLAEGGILRLVAVTQDYANIKEIGSIRSARPYYVELSSAYDSIYVHAGGSELAVSLISQLGVNNVNALAYEGVTLEGIKTFYRNQNRLNSGFKKEHTLFSSGQGIANVISNKKYRTELTDKEFTAFNFDPAFSGLDSQTSATYVKIPHSNYSVSEFKYNETEKLYYHYQYGKEHMDGATNTQIATKNVFVLFADQKFNPDGLTRNITLTGTGKGYYMTDGKVVSITWKRDSRSGSFTYLMEDGSELKVQCGKSYIAVADTKIYSSITIS